MAASRRWHAASDNVNAAVLEACGNPSGLGHLLELARVHLFDVCETLDEVSPEHQITFRLLAEISGYEMPTQTRKQGEQPRLDTPVKPATPETRIAHLVRALDCMRIALDALDPPLLAPADLTKDETEVMNAIWRSAIAVDEQLQMFIANSRPETMADALAVHVVGQCLANRTDEHGAEVYHRAGRVSASRVAEFLMTQSGNSAPVIGEYRSLVDYRAGMGGAR